MLCNFCRNLTFSKPHELDLQGIGFINDWVENPFSMISIHQPSQSALKLSADHGCRVCGMFWARLFGNVVPVIDECDGESEVGRVVLRRDWPVQWIAEEKEGLLIREPIELRCGKHTKAVFTDSPLSDDLSELFDRACALSPQREGLPSHVQTPLDCHTGSQHNFELMKLWLQNCLTTHRTCGHGSPASVPPPLPTRIIDLEFPERPRLRETHGLRSEYLTLSYCWGQGKRLLTTREAGRYEEFGRSIPIDERMPKTFREALQVTRSLGYRYLWCDALCIMQDDPDDVQREMSRMGEIYRQSTLTISAASGPNTDTGLFVERDPRGCKPCNTTVTVKEGEEYLSECVSLYELPGSDPNPLSGRGWILQEQILSRRTLIFTPHQVKWQCMTAVMEETNPSMAPQYDREEEYSGVRCGDTVDAMRLLVAFPNMFKESQLTRANRRRNHFDIWYEMVEIYSTRALTVASDKLLAIAGLASLMQQNFGDTYGTGLWKEDLQQGLCWYVIGRRTHYYVHESDLESGRTHEYIAPSWSWAALREGHVHHCTFEENSTHVLAESLEIRDWEFSQPPGALIPFGQVTSAILTVVGRLREALLVPCLDEWDFESPSRRHYNSLWPAYAVDPLTSCTIGDVALDSLATYQYLSDRYREVLEAPQYHYRTGTAARLKEQHSFWYLSIAQPVWCLLQLVMDKYRHRSIVALVLTPHNIARREYRRIGLLFIDSTDMFPQDIFFNNVDGRYPDDEMIHIV